MIITHANHNQNDALFNAQQIDLRLERLDGKRFLNYGLIFDCEFFLTPSHLLKRSERRLSCHARN